jgi:nitrite reductase/ring-hydroxylating ferredoxin subunit
LSVIASLVFVAQAIFTMGALSAHAATVSLSQTPLKSWRANGVGWATVTIGNTAYLGGSFTSVKSPDGKTVVARANLAAFDVTTGALIQTFQADTDGTVYALATDGTHLFVGGAFTHVNTVSRSYLAEVDPTTGAVQSWTANTDATVYAMATSTSNLYIGGAFNHVSGKTRHNLAELRLSDAAVQSWAPAPYTTIHAIAATSDGSAVYVGGYFTKMNGQAVSNLAELNASGAVVDVKWNNLQGAALALDLNPDGSRLAVGVGGAGNQGAVFNTSTGARVWYQRCDGDGQAVLWDGDDVFTGFHDTCGSGTGYVGVTENDAVSGARVTSFEPTFNRIHGVKGLAGDTGHLVAVGDFTNVNGVSVQGIAIFPAV